MYWLEGYLVIPRESPGNSGTLGQWRRNTFQKKMLQDLKNSIYQLILTIFGGIKENGGFNPKPLKFGDLSVVSVTEHMQIVWKL